MWDAVGGAFLLLISTALIVSGLVLGAIALNSGEIWPIAVISIVLLVGGIFMVVGSFTSIYGPNFWVEKVDTFAVLLSKLVDQDNSGDWGPVDRLRLSFGFDAGNRLLWFEETFSHGDLSYEKMKALKIGYKIKISYWPRHASVARIFWS